MESFISTKKSQVWGFDVMVGVVIFVVALFLFYNYSINKINSSSDPTEDILLHARIISNYLMAQGYPEGWTDTNVTLIGLTDGLTRINQTKVENFELLALSDYKQTRNFLSTNKDFYITFEDSQGNATSIAGISSIGKDFNLDNPDNLVRVVRLAIYNSTVIQMVVHVW